MLGHERTLYNWSWSREVQEGLERWLRIWEHKIFFQRTWIQIQAPMCLQMSITLVPGDPRALGPHVIYRHICRQKAHTYKINLKNQRGLGTVINMPTILDFASGQLSGLLSEVQERRSKGTVADHLTCLSTDCLCLRAPYSWIWKDL